MSGRVDTSDGIPRPVDPEQTGETAAKMGDVVELRQTVADVVGDLDRLRSYVGSLERHIEEQRRIIAAGRSEGRSVEAGSVVVAGDGARIEIVIRVVRD